MDMSLVFSILSYSGWDGAKGSLDGMFRDRIADRAVPNRKQYANVLKKVICGIMSSIFSIAFMVFESIILA